MNINVKTLDFDDYKNNLPFLIEKIREILVSNEPVLIIKNFPYENNNKALENLSFSLGNPLKEDRNIDKGIIYKVEYNEQLKDTTYSNTNLEFLCHTDCPEISDRPDTLILLCEKNSDTGGESHIVFLSDILKELSSSEIGLLSEKAYPFKTQFFSIIDFDENKFNIRYNRVSLDISLLSIGSQLDNEFTQVIDKLDLLIENNKFSFKLNKNDCLILNNKKILHGRAAFQEISQRSLKRVRLYLNN